MAVPWWLSGGIVAANCLAAYTPKGAASLAASYDNNAAPGNGLPDGTYDVTEGAALSWDAATGWYDTSTGKYLVSALPGNTKPFTFAVRLASTKGAVARNIIQAANSAANGQTLTHINGSGLLRVERQGVLTVATSATALVDGADTVVIFTYSGVGAWAFYFNGVPGGSGTNNTSWVVTTTWVSKNVAGGGLSGSLKAFAKYSVALTAGEAATLSAAMAAL